MAMDGSRYFKSNSNIFELYDLLIECKMYFSVSKLVYSLYFPRLKRVKLQVFKTITLSTGDSKIRFLKIRANKRVLYVLVKIAKSNLTSCNMFTFVLVPTN